MNWFKNMKISVKLLAGFILVALIAGAIGGVGISNIIKINNNNDTLYDNATVPMTYLVDVSTSFLEMRCCFRDMVLENNSDKIIDAYEKALSARNLMESSSEKFKETILSDDIKKVFGEYDSSKNNYFVFLDNNLDELLSLCKDNKDEEAINFIGNKMSATANELKIDIDNLIELKTEAGKTLCDNNSAAAKSSIFLTVVFVVCGFILSLIIGITISMSISNPVKKLSNVADLIAKGDLDINIDIQTKDELGVLAGSFRNMSDNLNSVMTNILFVSEQVSESSKQVSESSIMLAQGATEQASSVEELTASIEEVSSQTALNSENAVEANNLTNTAKSTAMVGNDQMDNMLNAMGEINDASKSISKIIKVIDDIAFQTNILALNAAVEAARAGQHGKGFAVVAEEVRNLAARSANAAKKTTTLIESSIDKVKNGTKIAQDTAAALKSIVESVAQSADLVSQIADASKEQSTALSQINQSVELVSQVVQTNSSTAEESSSASEELAEQAEVLKEQVATFKIKDSFKQQNKEDLVKEIKPEPQKDEPLVEENKSKISLSDKEFDKY